MSTPLWIDSHAHMTDKRITNQLADWICEAQDLGIGFYMQGGVDPKDWAQQQELFCKYPGQIGLCFGLHPYRAAAWAMEDCELALVKLMQTGPKALAIGEMGLDFRPHIIGESRERQIDVFRAQLEISETLNKPVVLHIVQAHAESLQVLGICGVPQRGGMVHSFNGSWGQAQDFLNMGLCLSFGGPLARESNYKLHEVARRTPNEFILLETDCPDQSPDLYRGQLNPLKSLMIVAQKMSQLKKMTTQEILDISRSNFIRVFGGHFGKLSTTTGN